MLAKLAEQSGVVRATFDEASTVLGYDLWQLCQQGPPEDLNSTERTQPAMLTAGIATWRLWRERKGATPSIVTGHSLGEFTALVAADAIDFATCVDLVRFRGQVMQEAVPAGRGAMAALLGLEDAEAEAACAEAEATGGVVEAVNFNSQGQVVIAGEREPVLRAMRDCTREGREKSRGIVGQCARPQQPDARRGHASRRAPGKNRDPRPANPLCERRRCAHAL